MTDSPTSAPLGPAPLDQASEGVIRLASALGEELLREAGWSTRQIAHLKTEVSGLEVVPFEDGEVEGTQVQLSWNSVPSEEMSERVRESAPLVMMTLWRASDPELV